MAAAAKRKGRPTKRQKEYMEKLRDPRWQKLRLEVLDAAAWRCTWCGTSKKNLQIHHGYYSKGAEPWEYPKENLHVLCEHCHEQAESLKVQVLEVVGLIHAKYHHHVYYGLEEFRETLSGGGVEALEPWKPIKEDAA